MSWFADAGRDPVDRRRIFDHSAERRDVIGKDIRARSVAPWAPGNREAVITHSADITHDGIEVLHLEGDAVK
jgi:hypothetical protein